MLNFDTSNMQSEGRSMGWIIPENKLDAQQRDFIDHVDFNKKNVWIKGFPGSGKSVLLAYTVKKIRRNTPNASILVVVFTQSLISMFKAAFNEMGMHNIEIVTYYAFKRSWDTYDYILSDEVQDLTPSVLSAMNNRASHVIVAGDENQSIYESDPQNHEPTVTPSQIDSLLSTRNFELGIIHRLCSSIINAVQKFLPRMNIFTAKRDMSKQSTQVRLCEATSQTEEVKYVMQEAKKAVRTGNTAAILIPSQSGILQFIQNAISEAGQDPWNVVLNQWGKTDYNQLNRYLGKCRIPLQYVGNGYGDLTRGDKICIMTYHSSKGLDFDNVFMPGLNNSLFINKNETLSKTLFMVAMTRSRNNLYLTYYGYKHSYLNNFANDCHEIDIHRALTAQDTMKSGTNVFGF